MEFYITVSQSYFLKKLGFDYPVDEFYCIKPFYGNNLYGRFEYKPGMIVKPGDVNKSIRAFITPRWTIDQVLRWFRVKYQIDVQLSFTSFKTWTVTITDESAEPLFDTIYMDEEFAEHCDGEIAAISMVLSKLVKNDPYLYDEFMNLAFDGELNCQCKH